MGWMRSKRSARWPPRPVRSRCQVQPVTEQPRERQGLDSNESLRSTVEDVVALTLLEGLHHRTLQLHDGTVVVLLQLRSTSLLQLRFAVLLIDG